MPSKPKAMETAIEEGNWKADFTYFLKNMKNMSKEHKAIVRKIVKMLPKADSFEDAMAKVLNSDMALGEKINAMVMSGMFLGRIETLMECQEKLNQCEILLKDARETHKKIEEMTKIKGDLLGFYVDYMKNLEKAAKKAGVNLDDI